MKRKWIVLSGCTVLAALLSAGTLAFFTTTDTAKNVITTGNIDLQIQETTVDGKPFDSTGTVIMPGDVVDKIVTVENTGTDSAFVRVDITVSSKNLGIDAGECVEVDINEAAWTFKEGFYYYDTALEPGRSTEPLFTQVTFDGRGMDNSWIGDALMINVDAYGVQSKNNGTDPLRAAGWPPTEEEVTVDGT